MNDKKIYTLNRIFPVPLKNNPKKILGRLSIAYLGFLEPIVELLFIPGKIYNSIKPKKYKNFIAFSETAIRVSSEDQSKKYDYSEIEELKIYFNRNSNELYEAGSTTTISNIHFQYKGANAQFYFENGNTEVIKLLKFLYQKKVKFKEYRDGQRTFLLKQPGYKKVQELKRQYNLEW